jgi:hypothetical protein
LLLISIPPSAWAQQPQGERIFQVNTYTTAAQEDPSVAMGPDGRFVVVWTSRGPDGNGDGIFAQRFDQNGIPTGGEFQVNTYTNYSQSRPAVAVDSDGDFVVVWDSYYQDGSYFGVYAKRYDKDGNPVTGEFRVSDGTLGIQDQPDVAMAPDGSFVVVWRDGAYTNTTDILSKRYNASGTALGSDFQVNTYSTGPQYQPTVGIDSDGEFIVAWTSDYKDGNSTGIVAQRFGCDGSPDSTGFVVNSYTTAAQFYPSAAMTPGGDFVVVWNSFGQDGSDRGVFGQSFHRSGVTLGSEIQVNTYTAGR